MKKLKTILCAVGLMLGQQQVQADKGLNIIQITQPEKQRVDFTFAHFFFLDAQEESALQNIFNKHTLYSYDWLVENTSTSQKSLTRKIGDFEILINGRKPTNGAGGAAPAFELTIQNAQKHKILDHVSLKMQDFESMSFVQKDSALLIMMSPLQASVKNYKINSDIETPIKQQTDLETYLVK